MSAEKTEPKKKKKNKEAKSIWESDITGDELAEMSHEERARRFPNDYDRNGNPYGDF